MAKDKLLRDAQRAFQDNYAAQLERKQVQTELHDTETGWPSPFRDERERPCFQVTLLPPFKPGSPWRVQCRDANSTYYVRDFSNEARARDMYNGIHDFTHIKTLVGRGFRHD